MIVTAQVNATADALQSYDWNCGVGEGYEGGEEARGREDCVHCVTSQKCRSRGLPGANLWR